MTTGAEEQLETLYRRHGVRLLAYLRRRVTEPEDAADLLGEVLATAWRRRDDLPAPDDDVLWLFGVAHKTLANHRRSRQRRDRATGALAELLRSQSPPPPYDDGQSLDVRRALASLPAVDREVVTLSAWDGLTSREIGVVLEMPAATVRSRLRRARSRLRAQLDAGPQPPVAFRPGSDAVATGGREASG